MSTPENIVTETSKSSVKITCNAKGDAQPEIKVYEDTTAEELERIRSLAVSAYLETQREVRSAAFNRERGLA
jgi:hypothetical protein